MRKRTLLLITLLLIAVLALAACGGDDDKDDKPAADTQPTEETTTVDDSAANASPMTTYETLTVTEAHDQASADANAIIVDVREPSEWQTTGVPEGATLISLATVTSVGSGEVDGLPKDQPIYVICNSGNRSRVAADHLISLGYPTVYNIDGGIQAWIGASLPTEPYTP